MSKKTIVQLVDDLTEEAINEGEGETVQFSFDGNFYEIDLNHINAAAFREVLDRHAHAGRKIPRSTRRSGSKTRVKSSHDPQAVRAWAHGAGFEVPEKGRIPQSVIDAYNTRNELSEGGTENASVSGQQHEEHGQHELHG
ncbi:MULTISPECIES: histone-like nucleoid-structuring protein Lsr2 [Bacillati]|uniref:histone-like nucleoid-structuring protein Lsr2 n=1 Tax=Bacillati TaxID=1783272 RepID=UPI000BD221D0|nr:Lsr2 family protein [Rathayibacter rathayi]MWV76082.1 Lsr2 family protein [Rathayibacter rathayi NCPPB 2980 = VKM Ac-1601]TWD63563.1 Lsr2 protein [Rathayibacter rathayi]SOE06095.1 Lsr2 protein [Rathayibacter rathayi] [Rathayibacter rathayi NCPPB 2980 = VKM Ac-1601]